MEKVSHDKTTIYVLVDPRTNEPFYVGSTWRKLSERLNQLVTEARDHCQTTRPVSLKIREIKYRGLRPIIRELEVCDTSVRARREAYWVERLIADGVKLANTGKGYNPIYEKHQYGFYNV